MRILDRYITGQVIVTGLFAVGVLSLVLVLGTVFKQLLDLLVNHNVPDRVLPDVHRLHHSLLAHVYDSVGFPHGGAADLRAALGGE